jgi:alpha-tubulin suppressor-like RCC1 family protein
LFPGLTDVQAVATGGALHFALKKDGTVFAWGLNIDNSTNIPADISRVVQISVKSYHGLLLTEDGTVYGTGFDEGAGDVPADLGPAIAIAAGGLHSLAVRQDGTVAAWGWNRYGQCDVPADLTNVVGVSGGYYHSIALKKDGTVVVWGGFDPATLAPPPGLSNVVQVSAGTFHNVALKSDGTVVSWGSPDAGNIQAPPHLRNVVSVTAGSYHNMALTTMEEPFIMGQPVGGKFSSGQTILLEVTARGFGPFQYQWWKGNSPIAGATNSSVAIPNASTLDDGEYKVIVSNAGGSTPSENAHVEIVDSAFFMMEGIRKPDLDFNAGEPPRGLSDLTAVTCSYTHALALHADGTVVGWAFSGQLTYGAETPPTNLTSVTAIACGEGFSLALRKDGSIVSWGNVPGTQAPAPDDTNYVAIAAAGYFAYALKNDGSILSFANTPFFPPEMDVTMIAAFCLPPSAADVLPGWVDGLRADGSVWRWGQELVPEGVDAGLTNAVVTFDAAYGNLVGVRADGTVMSNLPDAPVSVSDVKMVSAGPVQVAYVINKLYEDPRVAYTVALKTNGTVVSWGGGPDTSGLTNVTLISVRNNYALVQTLWPAIVRQPLDQVLDVGYDANFSVEMRGVGPFRFQWRRDGIDMPGQTNISLRIPNAQPSDQGKYSVLVSNRNGSIESKTAELKIFAPRIVVAPTPEVAFVGGKVGFSVTVDGSKPITYQWLKGATAISGATNRFYGIESVQMSDEGNYSVAITNPGGSTNSTNVTLKIYPTPVWKRVDPGTVVAFDGPPAPADLTDAVAIAVGNEGLALRADGTIRQWGQSASLLYPPPTGLSNLVGIAASLDQFAAVKNDGTVLGWGDWSAPTNLYGVVSISICNRQITAFKCDGSFRFWGDPSMVFPPDASSAIAFGFGSGGRAALTADGRVFTWFLGATANFLPINDAVQIAVDNDRTLVVRSDGSVYGFALFVSPLPDADFTNVGAIALGPTHYGIALKRDGSVIGWDNATVPDGLGKVSAIAAGRFGAVIQAGPPSPKLEIHAAEASQGLIHADVVPPGFTLEASDRVDGAYTAAPVNIDLDQLFLLSKPQQFFRLRKAQ